MTTCQAELKLWSAMEKLNQSRRSQDVHANTILYTAIKSVRSGAPYRGRVILSTKRISAGGCPEIKQKKRPNKPYPKHCHDYLSDNN